MDLEAEVIELKAALAENRRRTRRLSLSNIVLTVVVLAFGGATAAYALAPANSVNSASIIDRSIGTPDVKVGAFAGQTILDNSMTTKDIRDNGIHSIDIADGTLLAKDVASGAFELKFVSVTSASDSESPKEVSVDCPAGTYVLGTSYDIAGGKTGTAPNQYTNVIGDKLLPTSPNGILTDKPTRVYFQAYESGAGTTANWSIRVAATCAKIS